MHFVSKAIKLIIDMAEETKVKTLEKVVIRFSGDSGDGMQLTGTIFSNLSAIFGNEISTFLNSAYHSTAFRKFSITIV